LIVGSCRPAGLSLRVSGQLSQDDRWLGLTVPIFRSYDVAPDGKRFLVRTIREQGAESPLVLVTNWQGRLAE